MGLYDNYILHNSNAIPTFNGSELDAIRHTNDTLGKAYEMKQGQYDKTDELLNATGDAVSHTAYDPIDKDTWNQINKETQDEINGYVSKGNLEDLYTNANKLAKRVAPKIIGLSNQVKSMQEAKKLLGSKEYNLDPVHQQTLLEMAKDDYKKRGGIKFDGYGNVIGGTEFSMGPVAEYVDRPEEIRKALSMMHANKFDNVTKTDDGYIGHKQGRADEWISPDDVVKATQYAKSLNNKWQAYDDQERKVTEFNSFKGLTDANALKMIQGMDDNIKVPVKGKDGKVRYEMQPNPTKSQLTSAIQNGTSPMALLKAMKSNQILEQQKANELGYAKSKVYHETKLDNETELGQLAIHKKKKELDEEPPFITNGPLTKFTSDEANADKVTESNTKLTKESDDLQKQKTYWEGQLSKVTGDKKLQIQANIDNLTNRLNTNKSQLQRTEQLLDYSKNRTAQNMGYTGGYDEFLTQEGNKGSEVVKTMLPGKYTTKDGKEVSAEDIAKAVLKGKSVSTNGHDFSNKGIDSHPLESVTIKTDKGDVTFTGKEAYKAAGLYHGISSAKDSRVKDFESTFRINHKSNIENYSINTEVIGLRPKDAEYATSTLKAATGGIEFSEPGQFSNVSESDRPKNYKVVGITPEGTANNVIFKVEELDVDNKPTGKYYDAKTVNPNIGEVLANKWNSSNDKQSKNSAQAIRFGSGARMVQNQQVGVGIPVGDMIMRDGKTSKTTLTPIRNLDGSVTYYLSDADGNKLLETSSSFEAGAWIDAHKEMTTPKKK